MLYRKRYGDWVRVVKGKTIKQTQVYVHSLYLVAEMSPLQEQQLHFYKTPL